MISETTLSEHLKSFFENPANAIQVGTRSQNNKPAWTRAVRCQVNDDRQSVILFVYRQYCRDAIANIRANGDYAATFIDIASYENYQIKGRGATILADLTPWLPLLEHFHSCDRYRIIDLIQLPHSTSDEICGKDPEDYYALHCPISDLYKQTPGPDAGCRI